MRVYHKIVAGLIAAAIVCGGLWFTPYVLTNRVGSAVALGNQSLLGLPTPALRGVVRQYERQLLQQPVRLVLRDKQVTLPLSLIGVSLNQEATLRAVAVASRQVFTFSRRAISPAFQINQAPLTDLVQREFAGYVTVPKDATLTVSPSGSLVLVPSASGETIDLTSLLADVQWRAQRNDWQKPIELKIASTSPSVNEGELLMAQNAATELLHVGLPISDGVTTWTIQPFTIRRLLRFTSVADPQTAGNQILGLTFDSEELHQYLTTTIAPAVDQPAIDARFERTADRITQFAVPQEGRALNIEASVASIQAAVQANKRPAQVVVDVTRPAIQDTTDIESLGIAELVAVGTSDFGGSPNNRIHNITEGTKRYHGLIIAPGQEFSFNAFLGPVDGAHGFKPELVIKKNVTIPEFGGGLCQVSTTLFRAAINAGLKITARRNHAYAVRYYGTPGFDATIYPPYTDLRFTNNTPGYLLIQAKSEGTKLTFELWGTRDNRAVTVDGPHPYARTSDGAVKATLVQKVIKDGAVLIDDTFYSNYRSPSLFHKPSPAPNATTPAAPTTSPSPQPQSAAR